LGLTETAVDLVTPRAGAVVVTLRGEHGRTEGERYEALFHRLAATHDLVVIDLTDALFVGSSFICDLIRCAKHGQILGTTFRLQIAEGSRVRRTLDVAGALEELDVAWTRDEALGTPSRGFAPVPAQPRSTAMSRRP
jgi:anti-anti-sigma regulatory factor